MVHVQPASHTGGINACSIKSSGSRRLSLIWHLKEAPDYNCLLSWNSSCHAEVADGGWQSGVTLGFLQLSPEADQNYEAHKNNHVNNLLCRQDDGTVILPFKAAGNSPLFSHMPSSSMEIIAQRAEKHILNQKRKKRGTGKRFFFSKVYLVWEASEPFYCPNCQKTLAPLLDCSAQQLPRYSRGSQVIP